MCYGCVGLNDPVMKDQVKMVAFGKRFSSYFVLCNDGCNWRNIPEAMIRILKSRPAHLPRIEYVNLGPTGQFCLRCDSRFEPDRKRDGQGYPKRLFYPTGFLGS